MNLNKLRNEAYSIAKANGWHEEEHSDNHWQMLIITEIAEAVQADRKNLYADVEAFKKYEDTLDFKENFERQIKNTVEDELADVAIRCLDLAGLRGFDLKHIEDNMWKRLKRTNEGFCEICYFLCRQISYSNCTEENIVFTIFILLQYARLADIDLDFFIRIKMKYNRLRGYHHGGKRY